MAGAATPTYLSVSDLNRRVKLTVQANHELRSIWVVGELSNVRKNTTEHLFPRLKDAKSEIGLVIWGSVVAKYAGIIKDGAKVLIRGDVRVYEARGAYQLYVDEIRQFGVGELWARFEALKKKLEDEGLFKQKRPTPSFPRVVGVVTSLSGAAVQDILRNLTGRFPPIRVIVCPVQVQGAAAAEDVADGIRALNKLSDPRPDVLIIGRGGGSLEDLWAFNEEAVARALFASMIPTISAVGHQTDVTIADFVADRRAATPTEAAVDAVPDQRALLDQLDETQRSLVEEMGEVLDNLEERLAHSAELLESLNPRRILDRGYAVVMKGGKAVGSASGIQKADEIGITMRDGTVDATVDTVKPAGRN
jgi:exodeoxyribonuclease VII large subunit